MDRCLRYAVAAAGVVTLLLALERPRAQLAARSLELDHVSTNRPEPLRLPNSALEPIDWNSLDGWAADDHTAAFVTFLASCRPLLRTIRPVGETRPMYFAPDAGVPAGRLPPVDLRKSGHGCSSNTISALCA